MVQPHHHSWLVHIRSKDCYDETDSSSQLTTGFNSHLQVDLASSIERIPGHRFHISLSSAEIPFTWYNVSTNLASRQIEVDSATSLNLDEGNYNIYDLVTAVTADATFPYSMTYDIKTNKVTLTNTDATGHTINFSSDISKELSKMLGFDRVDRTLLANATLDSDGVVNLRPVHSMFLYSNLAASNVLTTTYGGNIENIIDKIPLGNVDPLQVIAYNYYETAPFNSIITTDAIQSFQVSLRDQNGKLIQLNNARYELSLLIEQRLSYEFEMDHPAHPYPAIARRKEVDKEDKEEPKKPPPPPITPSPTIAPPVAPRPQPLGGSAIPILSSTPAAPTPVPTIKRPRIDEEQLQRQEMELDQAIMLAGIL